MTVLSSRAPRQSAIAQSANATDFALARARSPYGDDAEVGRLTAATVAAGHSILQIHKLAADDRGHVCTLLALMSLPPDTVVLDAGCGVGRVADLMLDERPDLRFLLLNISQSQLDMCPPRIAQLRADFHDMRAIHDGSFGAVMFNYSIGHALLDKAVAEASRILARGGILFIYDLEAEDSAALVETLGYIAHRKEDVCDVAQRHGLQPTLMMTPATNVDDFVALFGAEFYETTLKDVSPIVYRFIKC